MHRVITRVALIVALVFGLGAQRAGASEAGRDVWTVETARGTVSWRPGALDGWGKAFPGQRLSPGSTIRTNDGSTATLVNGVHSVTVAGGTYIRIAPLDRSGTPGVMQLSGRAGYDAQGLLVDALRVLTPHMISGASAASFQVHVSPRETSIAVGDGIVNVGHGFDVAQTELAAGWGARFDDRFEVATHVVDPGRARRQATELARTSAPAVVDLAAGGVVADAFRDLVEPTVSPETSLELEARLFEDTQGERQDQPPWRATPAVDPHPDDPGPIAEDTARDHGRSHRPLWHGAHRPSEPGAVDETAGPVDTSDHHTNAGHGHEDDGLPGNSQNHGDDDHGHGQGGGHHGDDDDRGHGGGHGHGEDDHDHHGTGALPGESDDDDHGNGGGHGDDDDAPGHDGDGDRDDDHGHGGGHDDDGDRDDDHGHGGGHDDDGDRDDDGGRGSDHDGDRDDDHGHGDGHDDDGDRDDDGGHGSDHDDGDGRDGDDGHDSDHDDDGDRDHDSWGDHDDEGDRDGDDGHDSDHDDGDRDHDSWGDHDDEGDRDGDDGHDSDDDDGRDGWGDHDDGDRGDDGDDRDGDDRDDLF